MNDRSLQATLADIFVKAIAQATQQPPEQVDPAVRAAGDPKFGDYQCNAAMGLARALSAKPRDVAERIKAAAEPLLADVAEPLEIAGPGFINIRLRSDWLAARLVAIPVQEQGRAAFEAGAAQAGEPAKPSESAKARFEAIIADRVGVPPVIVPEAVVVDYSSPNIAKQMHVGHLRSTIIGDALARVLRFQGNTSRLQNHLGDWGTQFGRVVVALWHMAMAQHHGDPDRLARELDELSQAARETSRRELLVRCIARRHEQEFLDDADDRAFERFLDRAGDGVTFDEMELAYRFVNALESAAAGLGILGAQRVSSSTQEAPPHYEDLSRFVTMMIQRHHQEQDRLEIKAWRLWTEISLRHLDRLYERLGVLLTRDDVRGESFYHDRLPPTIAALRAALPPRPDPAAQSQPWAECRDDQGAVCVFFWKPGGEPLFKNPEGAPLPLIVRKSDGAYLYASTDLAAIRFRVDELHATRILYVVGAPTKLHLDMVFTCARLAGWAPPPVRLEHVSFGQVLGEDRKLLRTRAGNAVKLAELLDEAERRAYALLVEREQAAAAEAASALAGRPEATPLTQAEKREIARRVGIASVKYFDLARERNADYVFNFDQMLAMQGNTAPYMLYAYARIRSIYRKAAERFGAPDVYAASVRLRLEQPAERALALRLARLAEVVDVVARDLTPHVLCTYLHELAAEFMRFYEACPVLAAADEATRLSRMRLCDLTARTLRLGLGLLGIEVIERM